MRSIDGQSWWTKWATFVGAALVAVAFQVGTPIGTSKVFAAYELPPGEMITNNPAIPRSMPQKEAYELYDPKIGGNFDVKNFWMRADLRVRPEFRTHTCFGSTGTAAGNCNSPNAGTQPNGSRGQANDFYVQQWVRLGIGYDLSPDVNFYMEIIDSATWGGNGSPTNAGNGGDPLNHNCSSVTTGACRLGVRAAYVLVRNLAGVQGLSMKAGRQYIVLGNHSLFGHFDWANTGYSHDGIMFSYSTKAFDSYLGWFRNSESDLPQAAAVGGSGGPPIVGSGTQDASRDVDMILFYNKLKSVPGFLIEPYYVYYKNNFGSADNRVQGLGTAKHSNQTRHMIGNRIEMRKANFDAIQETSYQWGAMGDTGGTNAVQNANGQNKNLHINAWAMRNWIGYTHYQSSWKPRFAVNFDYASGDGRANCNVVPGGAAVGNCKTANTFENFFPTNHIHMGYMDIMAWKNMIQPGANLQFRPTAADHVEFWWTNMNLASKQDNWYRGGQGVYIFSKPGNTKRHIGDELDLTWTHMFGDGKVAFQMTYGHMFTGGYISDNLGTSNDQAWGYAQVWMNF